jgi:hypothetical protein
MRKKAESPTRFHSMSLVVEKDGIRSNTGTFNSSQLANLLARYNARGLALVEAQHSKYCLCGNGKGEKVSIG